MPDVTAVLQAIDRGDSQAADQLLPLVYEDLRRRAAALLAHEKPGQTLNATALVHEAYLRLVGNQQFENRRHFFAAAAEAMRRILVENARRKARIKHGGGRHRVELLPQQIAADPRDDRLIDLDQVLTRLEHDRPELAQLVKLRYFVGLTVDQAAELLGVSARTVKRDWAYACAWLKREMTGAIS